MHSFPVQLRLTGALSAIDGVARASSETGGPEAAEADHGAGDAAPVLSEGVIRQHVKGLDLPSVFTAAVYVF